MTIHIEHAVSDEQIAATFDVMRQLRPNIERARYVSLIRDLMASDHLKLLALTDDNVVRAVASYRIMNMIYCGRLLYIDDLVTDERVRSKGYGSQLIARLRAEAEALGCAWRTVQVRSHFRPHAPPRYFPKRTQIDWAPPVWILRLEPYPCPRVRVL